MFTTSFAVDLESTLRDPVSGRGLYVAVGVDTIGSKRFLRALVPFTLFLTFRRLHPCVCRYFSFVSRHDEPPNLGNSPAAIIQAADGGCRTFRSATSSVAAGPVWQDQRLDSVPSALG